MNNSELITTFYTSFAEGNAQGMIACYHKDIVFQDPAFGKLEGDRACKMWEMLLSSKTGGAKIKFDNVKATNKNGEANWIAEYAYGDKKRKVINKVHANFTFKEGKIIEHIDTFNLYKWTKQAMGPIGYIMGWSSFMRNKIQQTTNKKLNDFISK